MFVSPAGTVVACVASIVAKSGEACGPIPEGSAVVGTTSVDARRYGVPDPTRAGQDHPPVGHDGGCQITAEDEVQIRSVNDTGVVEGAVKILLTHTPGAVKAMLEEQPEWEEFEMGVDSGATETVVNPEMLTNVDTVCGEAKKRGVEYEVATGELIPNLGEKRFVAVSEGGVTRKLTSRVADVNQVLLSVRTMMNSGRRVVFDSDGSYIEDKQSTEWMPLRDDGKMFLLKLWVRK